jgi:hypothetical protein
MPDPARCISVGELAEAFGPGGHTPPATDDLAGSTHVLYFESGASVEYRFLSGSRLAREAARGDRREHDYFALKARDGIYFVDLAVGDTPPMTVSVILDLRQAIATSLTAGLPQSPDIGESLLGRIARGDELTPVSAIFTSAAVDAPFTPTTPRHLPTSELVGRRVEYTYSPTERYEHIYLNSDFFTWHCLQGSDRGLADTDRCHYLKLGKELYFFVWREKIVPTVGAVVVDFHAMRTMGKIFGHAQGAGHAPAGSAPAGGGDAQGGDGPAVVDFRVGARARLLNVTAH